MAEQMMQHKAAKQTIPAGYKQTEVGVIPEDWTVYDLPDVIWYQEGPGLRKWQFKPTGLKVINVTNLQDNGVLDLDKTERHISWDEFEKTYKHFICDAGDLVIASSGNSYCKSSIVRACDLPLLMNTSVIRFKPINAFSKGYMDIYLRSQSFKNQIDLLITGGAQPNFGPAHLNKIKIPAPTDNYEQTAIANVLSDSDALIGTLEQLIAKKQAIKTATMQQLLTGRTRLPQFALRPDGTPKGYKTSELGQIPEDWKVLPLGELCHFENGDRSSNYPSSDEFVSFGIPFINAGHIDNGVIDSKGMDYISAVIYARLGGGKVKPGDLVYCLRGSLGKFGVVPDDFGMGAIASSLVIVRPITSRTSCEFISEYFKSDISKRMVSLWAGGAAQPNLGAKELANFLVPLPNNLEQTAIATILSDMDSELTALEQKLAKARDVKQGMMQQLLTGRIRLPVEQIE
ncbi:restriction endonuclease subunit S [Aeromonas allosaccharophila]|uniref:restriction endonuclease subunit S n=1 Tax=Aeromonas allosaccharophila TaxID=656 RepID=UPI003D21BF73